MPPPQLRPPQTTRCISFTQCYLQPIFLSSTTPAQHTSSPRNTHTQRRELSTTQSLSKARRTDPLTLLSEHAEAPPGYPYGAARWYKQSNTGLYGGRRVQFGNNVGPKSGTKTRRRWDPNVQHKQLYSEALGEMLRLRVTTRTLRTIDKVGGLDEYLLGNKPGRVRELGPEGWNLRWAVLNAQTEHMKARRAREPRLQKMIEAGSTPIVADELVEDAEIVENVEIKDLEEPIPGTAEGELREELEQFPADGLDEQPATHKVDERPPPNVRL